MIFCVDEIMIELGIRCLFNRLLFCSSLVGHIMVNPVVFFHSSFEQV